MTRSAQDGEGDEAERQVSHRGTHAQKQCFGSKRRRTRAQPSEYAGTMKTKTFNKNPKLASTSTNSSRHDHSPNSSRYNSTNNDETEENDSQDVSDDLTKRVVEQNCVRRSTNNEKKCPTR